MPEPLAVHFTTSPADANHLIASPSGVSPAIMLACSPHLGLVDAAEWPHTGDPSDATCDACIASPVWVEAARAVIAETLPPDRPVYMWPLRGRHRRPDEAMILTAAGRGVLSDRRVRVLEELAVAAWSLAISRPPAPSSFPATPGGDGTADRVLEDLRLRQFIADEVAAILKHRPDLAARYPTDGQLDDMRAARELAPAADLADPYGYPSDPALD